VLTEPRISYSGITRRYTEIYIFYAPGNK